MPNCFPKWFVLPISRDLVFLWYIHPVSHKGTKYYFNKREITREGVCEGALIQLQEPLEAKFVLAGWEEGKVREI